MKWFINTSTKNKFLIGFLVIVLLMAVIIINISSGLDKIRGQEKTMVEVELPMSLELAKLGADISSERVSMSRVVNYNDSLEIDVINEINIEMNNRLNKLSEIEQKAPQYALLLKDLSEKRSDYIKTWRTEIFPLIKEGNTEKAKMIYQNAHRQQYENIRVTIQKLSTMSEEKDKQMRLESANLFMQFKVTSITGSIIVVILSILIAVYLTGIIAIPLKKASDIAEQVAYGNLDVSIPSEERKDEIGILMLSLGMMVESLQMVTQEIRRISNALASSSEPEVLNEQILKLKKIVEQYKLKNEENK